VTTPQKSLLPITLFVVGMMPCLAQAAEPIDQAPRTLMRLPAWIESMGDEELPLADEAPSAPETADPTVPVADWVEDMASETRAPRTAGGMPASQQPTPVRRRMLPSRLAMVPSPTEPTSPSDEPQADDVPPQETTPPKAEPVAVTADIMPTLSIDQATFRGAIPGKTTRSEITATWGAGEAFTRDDGTEGIGWDSEQFARVEAIFDGDVVATIGIRLSEPVPVTDLTEQLEMADLRSVAVKDEQDVVVGNVYPERGVILGIDPETANAATIIIEPLDADSFVMRAEAAIETCSAYATADLQEAIRLDPQHLRAHRLLLALCYDEGKWNQALRLAETAGRLDPEDVWTKLKHAGVLLALDRADEAAVVLERTARLAPSSPLVAAQIAKLSGRACLTRTNPDEQKAVEYFAEAIRRGTPLLTDKQPPAVQAAAREVVLDAHLGTALAIAKGSWQQKARVIPKWIGRADAVTAEFTGEDKERQVLELELCRGVLAVAASTSEAVEPLPWVKRLLELRDQMGEGIGDPWRRRQLDWEVGRGLADALAAAQKRGDATDMLDNATLTAAYLERGSQQRDLTDAERKELGELMFRIGILHSLQRGDHKTAVTWFDRTIPLWHDNDRFDRDGDVGRLGESYVSMAISYWQVGRREDAVEISRHGVDLMVAAVDRSQLEERALAVAYGNLATMYAEEGDDAQSRTYAEMAHRAEATGLVR